MQLGRQDRNLSPPPYPFAHECSTQPPASSAARGTDWRCLAENEVNLERLTMTSNREQSDSGSRGPRSSRT
uniref:Uncharacterized protein n=1 Tax=Plectus sambesii TaxID=2011161 RepID=A0A914WSS2_9BILA